MVVHNLRLVWHIVLAAPLLTFGHIGAHKFLNARILIVVPADGRRVNQRESIVYVLNLLLAETAIVFLEFGREIIRHGFRQETRNFSITFVVKAGWRQSDHCLEHVEQKGEENIGLGGYEIDADYVFLRIGVAARVRFRDIDALIKRR